MKNTNEPEDNLDDGGRPAAQSTRAADPKGQPSKVLRCDAWDNEDNVGYTTHIENKLKFKNGQPTGSVNEPPNQDLQHARSKVPNFGAWEVGKGDVRFTECDSVMKVNKKECTVTPEPSNAPRVIMEERAKVSLFAAWEKRDNNGGGYTANFGNFSKKNTKTVPEPVSFEPQPNQNLNNKAQSSASTGTKNKVNDHFLRNKSEGSSASVGTSESATRDGRQNPESEVGKACLYNWARIPLLNEDWINQRAWPLGRVNELDYGGGGRPTVQQKGGNSKDVGTASQGFPTSRTKHLQAINNDTPVSYNQQQKTGHCFPWFGPGPGSRKRLNLKFWK